jgi:hypothetical protein
MTFHMSISNAEEPGFELHFKTLLSEEYSEFVAPTSISAIQVTSIELIGLEAVRANYTVVVDCTYGCDGGSSCRGDSCLPATSESVDIRTIPANCYHTRCPLMIGPYPTVDSSLVEPVPTVQIQITLEASIDDVNADRPAFELSFQTSVATILGVARSLIVITDIDAGSVIVSFTVVNGQDVAAITETLQENTIAGYSVVPSPVDSSDVSPAPGPPSPDSSDASVNQLDCTDDNGNCQSWAASGQCEVNTVYMQTVCALWCQSECEAQRPVPPPDESKGSGGGVIFAVVALLLVGGIGVVAFVMLGARAGDKSIDATGVSDFDAPFEEELPEGAIDKDGHIQEDDHEDNPLADFDVEAAGDDEYADT